MFIRRPRQKGQTILEYGALIAIIVATLMAMKVYFKRAYAGKIRDNADRVGEQFSPKEHTYGWTTTSTSESDETEQVKGGVQTTNMEQHSNRTGSETYRGIDSDSMWEAPASGGGSSGGGGGGPPEGNWTGNGTYR